LQTALPGFPAVQFHIIHIGGIASVHHRKR
jgi:hypothetical protein